MCSSLLYFERRRQSRSFLCSAPVVRVVRSGGETSQGRSGVCLDRFCDFRTALEFPLGGHSTWATGDLYDVIQVLVEAPGAPHAIMFLGSARMVVRQELQVAQRLGTWEARVPFSYMDG